VGRDLVDGHGVRDAVAGVEDNAGCAPGRVQRHDGLHSHVERWDVERLKEDLAHLQRARKRDVMNNARGHREGGRSEGVERAGRTFSRFILGLSGASVTRTGCSSGTTRSSLKKVWCQIFSMSSQLLTTPCSIGYLPRRVAQRRTRCTSAVNRQSSGEGWSTLEREDAALCHRVVTDVAVALSRSNHHPLLLRAPDDRGKHHLGCLVICADGKGSIAWTTAGLTRCFR